MAGVGSVGRKSDKVRVMGKAPYKLTCPQLQPRFMPLKHIVYKALPVVTKYLVAKLIKWEERGSLLAEEEVDAVTAGTVIKLNTVSEEVLEEKDDNDYFASV